MLRLTAHSRAVNFSLNLIFPVEFNRRSEYVKIPRFNWSHSNLLCRKLDNKKQDAFFFYSRQLNVETGQCSTIIEHLRILTTCSETAHQVRSLSLSLQW